MTMLGDAADAEIREILDSNVRKIMDLRVELASTGCLTPDIDMNLVKSAATLASLVERDFGDSIKYIDEIAVEYEQKLTYAAQVARERREAILGFNDIENYLKDK